MPFKAMPPAQPLISIIMPSFNQARFLPQALDSILQQDYHHLEVIVVDGGSDDETINLLMQYAEKDQRVRWFSEQDNGPADALNKALCKARGTLMGWLNSDDLYTPGAISRVINHWQQFPEHLMVYGQGQHVDENGKYLNDYPTLPADTPVQEFLDGCFICQPTVFFQRSMYVLLGELNTHLKTAFDFEYWLRAFTRFPERIGFIDQVQANTRLYDDCITLRMRQTVALESMQILHQYLGKAPIHWLLTYFAEHQEMAGGEVDIQHLRETVAQASAYLPDNDLQRAYGEIRRYR